MFVCPQRTARRYQGVFPDSVEAPEADFASLALARMAAAADFFKKSRRVSPEKRKSAFTNLEGDWTERGRGRAAGRLFLAGKIFCRRRIAAFSKQPAKSDAPREPSCSAQKSFRRVFWRRAGWGPEARARKISSLRRSGVGVRGGTR